MLTEGVTLGRIRVGLWVVAERRDEAFDGSTKVDNPLQERTTIAVPIPTIDLRLTQQTGVQVSASIPNITRTAVVSRPSGAFTYREQFRGLGDTAVIGWYRLRPIHRWNVTANLGASLPTGRTEVPRFRSELVDGSLVPMSRLQRGSGTFDPLLGVSVDRRLGKMTLFGNVAARTPLYENDKGLRTGASWEVNTGLAREIRTHRIVGYSRLGWLHRRQDVFQGTPVLVGGGDWFYVTPGAAIQVGKGVNVQGEVKIPVYRSLANRQLDSPAVFQFGISRTF